MNYILMIILYITCIIYLYRLPKSVRKTLDILCKMFSKFDGVKLSSQLTVVLASNNDLDVHQLELWHKSIASVIEVWKFFKVSILIYGCSIILDTKVLTGGQVIG